MSVSWQVKYGFLLILLIIVPSFFLAYFSVRSKEAERLAYRQRISETYQRLAQFAVSKIEDMIDDTNESWIKKIKPTKFAGLPPNEQAAILDKLIEEDVLISNAYLVTNASSVSYPPDSNIKTSASSTHPPLTPVTEIDEWLRSFRELSDNAEEFEFEKEKPDRALNIYRQIVDTFPVPRLQAIAIMEIARIYMFKKDWQKAYENYQKIVQEYPQERDLNNLHLRFYAQFQCVAALENFDLLDQAMSALLTLYQDLLDHSDEINREQYEFFVERIQRSFQNLEGAFPAEQRNEYSAIYNKLQEQKKKNIGTTYLVEKLYQRLIRDILKQETYRPRVRYFSDFAVEQPYLVAYILLSEGEEYIVESALALEINLEALKTRLFPQIINGKNFPRDVAIAFLDQNDNFVMGDAEKINSKPEVLYPLRDPLDFWHLSIFPTSQNPLTRVSNIDIYINLLGIFLLFLFILVGAGVIVYNIRKQQQLSLQKTTFISSISHELKTPLTSIKMFVDFLSKNKKLKEDAETQKYLNIIHAESERLNRLVDNVLDFSRIERGVKKYHFEYEEAGAVIRSVVDAFNYHAEIHGIKIELDLQEPLPEIRMDRHAISQALINLFSNAIKYSVDKKPVKVIAGENGKVLTVKVQDQGIGIKQKYIKQIFNDYYRIEVNGAENIAGTGLGLSLVKHIAEAHGGRVFVESVYEKGSTFTLELPLNENGKNTHHRR
jgi:signal transduction histidine kinase